MNKKIWKCEIHQDLKNKKTDIVSIWRPVANDLYLRITPSAAPPDVCQALLLTPEHGGEPWDDGKPFIFDFRKLKRLASKGKDFFKTFDYKRVNAKYWKRLEAHATFEMVEPTAGYDHPRWHYDDDKATMDQLLQIAQGLAKEALRSEFPFGLQSTFDKCRTQEEADLVIKNVEPTRSEKARFNHLCQLAGVHYGPALQDLTDGSYCAYCGNMHVSDPKEPCVSCSVVLHGRLSLAWEVYKTLQEERRQCCGGLSSGKDHFHFHGKNWDCTYPSSEMRKTKEWKGVSSTSVEMGVQLHEDHAETYWIFDNDSSSDSNVYGDSIRYDDPEFWSKLDRQLDQAAEAAWNSDICSCEHCGYHFHVGNGPCGCSGSEEAGEDD